ncbi:fatty acid alpha-hydroxylase [Tieghemiomyces parasiticus]|uniref:Ceramide very long chain fatty acid hydroxylase n=1 Tax=Tieghemiomyces parasiticus TaxID=78921 RepID=A0A9W8DXQ5_9FUNG|nr:fatty acid alpha-hydroxylase [Tieghemiomyces parasiticus]
MRTFTADEVRVHNHAKSLWVTYQGQVYDITTFAPDHPGGIDYLLHFAGGDVEAAMKDPLEHIHSESAYTMLKDYHIGILDTSSSQATPAYSEDELQAASSNEPLETDKKADFESEKFLDLDRPLFPQMVRASFSKEFYMEQIHKPRYVSYAAPFFGLDSPLEVFTKTPWFVVPLVWIPIVLYYAGEALARTGGDTLLVASYMAFGVGFWTLIEYVLHRFIFHIEALLPDHPLALTIHFTLHGVHHYLPMDRMRLVMPPVLGLTLAYPLVKLGHLAFPAGIAHAVIAGTMTGYIMYDLTHYYLHHGRPFLHHLRSMKTYHLAHHYKNFNLGFGVTVKVWDRMFNTLLS